jgi:hypothetical protein
MYLAVWSEHALDDLADVWVSANPPVRERIETAVRRVNLILRDFLDEFGESRDKGRRIGFVEPLIVIFRIIRESATVRIDHVWRSRK